MKKRTVELMRTIQDMMDNNKPEKEILAFVERDLETGNIYTTTSLQDDAVFYYQMAKRFPRKRTVYVSNDVINKIHAINDQITERVLFSLIYMYKERDNRLKNPKISEIKRLGGLRCNYERVQKSLTYLCQHGYINTKLVKRDLIYTFNSELLEDGDIYVDETNCYMYYLEQIGVGKYIRCAECGCIVEKKSNRQKYCADCAHKINIQKTNKKV